MEKLIETVVGYCDRIQNNRNPGTILESIVSECDELREEVEGETPGPDGIFGESIDVLISTIDMLRQVRPHSTMAELIIEIEAYAEKKCQKWETKYGHLDYDNHGLTLPK